MTSHEEWFSHLEKPEQPGVVETGDDICHPIEHIGGVPLSYVGQKGRLMNVMHVPTITKNLLSIKQIIDQGMQVRFTHLGCFIEEEGQIIVQGRQEGRMFILDTNDVGTAIFPKDIKSNRISTCGIRGSRTLKFYQRLQELQTKQVVFGLPKFSLRKAQVCEACKLGKQHRLPFPDE